MSGKPSIHTPEEFISGYRHHSKLWTRYRVSPSTREIIFLNSASGYKTQLLTLKLNHYIRNLAMLARSWAKQDARNMNTCAHTSMHCFSVGLKKTEILFCLFLWNVPYDFFSILIFKNRSSALNYVLESDCSWVLQKWVFFTDFW